MEIDKQLLKVVLDSLNSKKAERIVIMNLTGKSDLCDYQVVCSGQTEPQTIAIADALEKNLRNTLKIKPAAIEGRKTGHWILMDYGSLMIHVFTETLRDYYAIEDIWPDTVIDHQQ